MRARRLGQGFSLLTILVLLGAMASSALALPRTGGEAGKKDETKEKVIRPNEIMQAYHAGRDGDTSSDPASYHGPSIEVQTTYVGREAAEPTVEVTKSGAAFYAAATFDSFPSASPVQLARTEILRSTNGGREWTSVQPPAPSGATTEPPISLDPYVWIDERTDRVFSIDLYVGCAYLIYSDNDGKSWESNQMACGRPINDHQTLFGGPPARSDLPTEYPNILYYCWNDVASSSCSKSLDGGQTFFPTDEPAYLGVDPDGDDGFDVDQFCGGLHGHGVVGPDGTVYLPREYCGRPFVAVSTTEGDSWRRVQVADIAMDVGEADPSVAVDATGNVYYTFVGANRLPYLVVSKDGGLTWSDALMIAPPGVHETNFPTMDVGDAGNVVITFPGTTAEKPDEGLQRVGEEQRRRYEHRAWNSYVVTSTNALGSDPLFVSVTGNERGDPIHRGDCYGRCSGMFDFLDATVAPNGDFWVTATDTCSRNSDDEPKKNCVKKDGTKSGDNRALTSLFEALKFHGSCELACGMDGVVIKQIAGPRFRS